MLLPIPSFPSSSRCRRRLLPADYDTLAGRFFGSAFVLSAINVKTAVNLCLLGCFFFVSMVLSDCSGCKKSTSLDFDWWVWLKWDFVDQV